MKEVVIQTVCGAGVGSSQFLKMQIDEIAAKNGISDVKTFVGDVITAASAPCDAIFTSNEIAEVIRPKARVPVVVVKSFISKTEILEKLQEFLETFGER